MRCWAIVSLALTSTQSGLKYPYYYFKFNNNSKSLYLKIESERRSVYLKMEEILLKMGTLYIMFFAVFQMSFLNY